MEIKHDEVQTAKVSDKIPTNLPLDAIPPIPSTVQTNPRFLLPRQPMQFMPQRMKQTTRVGIIYEELSILNESEYINNDEFPSLFDSKRIAHHNPISQIAINLKSKSDERTEALSKRTMRKTTRPLTTRELNAKHSNSEDNKILTYVNSMRPKNFLPPSNNSIKFNPMMKTGNNKIDKPRLKLSELLGETDARPLTTKHGFFPLLEPAPKSKKSMIATGAQFNNPNDKRKKSADTKLPGRKSSSGKTSTVTLKKIYMGNKDKANNIQEKRTNK